MAAFAHIHALPSGTSLGSLGISPEHQRLIRSWNPPQLTSRESLLHEVFAQRVAQMPRAVAVDAWNGQLSYGDVNRESTKLGRRLLRRGIGPGSWVLVCLEKSVWMAVVMMAVLKTGAAFACSDPDAPRARILQMTGATGAKILIVSKSTSARFGGIKVEMMAVPLEDEPESFNEVGAGDMAWPRVSPSDPAVAVFTSGTTGTPKGIVLSHTNLSTAAHVLGQAFDIGPGTRVLQFAAHTFDICLQDYLGSLLRGAAVCVPSDEQRWNGVGRFIVDARVTLAILTPTVARMLSAPRTAESLRTLILCGEISRPDEADAWIAAGVQTYNAYAPAETTILCTSTPKPGSTAGRSHVVWYGLNMKTWIADATTGRTLCPIGAVGELYLEGPQVAQGYVNNAKLTEACFLRNPPWAQGTDNDHCPGGQKFYQTGDLARYCADGAIEVMGRTDSQIKVGGQRVEPMEIEHNLRQLPGISGAVVFVPKHGPFIGKLTVVIERGAGTAPDPDTDRAPESALGRCPPGLVNDASLALSRRVPGYMVPSLWLATDLLPMSASGKLNRKSILEAAEAMPTVGDGGGQPATVRPGQQKGPSSTACTSENEAFLQTVCGAILGTSAASVDLDTSFVKLGGDSINAMQVVGWCR
ncbi:acetyl-CoA synthetase-like protein, partial [Colletotrichum falcatum]